jgi:hypothetical protein
MVFGARAPKARQNIPYHLVDCNSFGVKFDVSVTFPYKLIQQKEKYAYA